MHARRRRLAAIGRSIAGGRVTRVGVGCNTSDLSDQPMSLELDDFTTIQIAAEFTLILILILILISSSSKRPSYSTSPL
jgi:hypothetical protein